MKARKISLSVLVFLLFNMVVQAQAEAVGSNPEHVNQVLSDTLLVAGIVLILGTLFAVMRVNSMITESVKIQLLQEHGIEALDKAGIQVQKESWWKRQYKKWTNVVPIEKEADVMLDHNYDGIRELDNNLPPWWVAMFYITIAFGGVYVYFNHFSDYSTSSREAYAIEMEEAEEAVKAYLASQANTVDETNAEMIEDEVALAIGESVYKANCAACHGQLGEGGVGPNLTDPYWLHGGSIKNVFKTIKYGVPEKGMIAWQAQLRPAEIHKIASYIMTLSGTNPPNAKEAQGELYQAENIKEESEMGMNKEMKNKSLGMR